MRIILRQMCCAVTKFLSDVFSKNSSLHCLCLSFFRWGMSRAVTSMSTYEVSQGHLGWSWLLLSVAMSIFTKGSTFLAWIGLCPVSAVAMKMLTYDRLLRHAAMFYRIKLIFFNKMTAFLCLLCVHLLQFLVTSPLKMWNLTSCCSCQSCTLVTISVN